MLRAPVPGPGFTRLPPAVIARVKAAQETQLAQCRTKAAGRLDPLQSVCLQMFQLLELPALALQIGEDARAQVCALAHIECRALAVVEDVDARHALRDLRDLPARLHRQLHQGLARCCELFALDTPAELAGKRPHHLCVGQRSMACRARQREPLHDAVEVMALLFWKEVARKAYRAQHRCAELDAETPEFGPQKVVVKTRVVRDQQAAIQAPL